ncbi:type II general secretion pathway GSP D protein [Sporocytophaga myxococcoides]|uniref:Type II general secretion pathway GSP D protein n=1 Tax=Sporocytophaga myxococcoides TaxID=153721 RepID=A0A098LF94_9BACT|nr:secretin and TonB N-terminal domain-containing protein [Sporocytophaga myxococcoides]GAL85651.1 type II general secretion pathway GSP D protein [Sporocytophaga myxococcoides]
MKTKVFYFYLILFLWAGSAWAQQDRYAELEQRLRDLADLSPGLKETVDFSVSGASIQEFLRGIAESHNLNISVDPTLNIRVYNNFNNEKVYNILLFLAKEHELDVQFVGSIMSFKKYNPPPVVQAAAPPREIIVKYNSYTNLLSLDLKNDTLDKVAKKITQTTKKNVILSSGLTGKLVSAYIEDMPFENAIQKMAYANSLKIFKTDDEFYVIKTIEEGEDLLSSSDPKNKKKNTYQKPQSQNKANTQQGNASASSLFVDVNEDSLGRKTISLEAVNAPIADVVKAVTEEMGISYFLFSDIKGNATTSVNNVRFDDFLSRLLQGTDYTYKIDNKIYMIGDRKLEGLRANKVIQFQYRSLDAVQEIIPAELKKGVEIKEFKELNSILLSGSLPQIFEIEAFVRQLDKVVPMVMIEVILMDVRKGRKVETGISAGISDTVKTGGSIFPGLKFNFGSKSINEFLGWLGTNNVFNIGKVTPQFYIGLTALESNDNVNVRSTPKLSTLNGHDANLSIGTTRYYALKTQNVVGSLTPTNITTETYNAVQANLSINIKPIVSGDDQVTLNIDVSITDFIGEAPSGPPPSSTSQFKSIVRVRNEEMVVLGGLERSETSERGSGVPILSRIPIIKWLFSSRSRSKSKMISVVFIKPTIIY